LDGGAKQRFLAVPDGRKASFNEAGDLDLPVGSVAIKTFAMGKFISRVFPVNPSCCCV
jgi:hypothetical protein